MTTADENFGGRDLDKVIYDKTDSGGAAEG